MSERIEKTNSDLQIYVDILQKHGVNVTNTPMYGPVSLVNLETDDICCNSWVLDVAELTEILTPTNLDREIFQKAEIGNTTSIEAFVVDENKFESVVDHYSKTYRNFSFYGLLYEQIYYLFEDKFYDLPKVSKIRGAFWGVKKDI
jgi:hypothetical protein